MSEFKCVYVLKHLYSCHILRAIIIDANVFYVLFFSRTSRSYLRQLHASEHSAIVHEVVLACLVC